MPEWREVAAMQVSYLVHLTWCYGRRGFIILVDLFICYRFAFRETLLGPTLVPTVLMNYKKCKKTVA